MTQNPRVQLNGLPVTEEQVDVLNSKAPVLGSETGAFLYLLVDQVIENPMALAVSHWMSGLQPRVLKIRNRNRRWSA